MMRPDHYHPELWYLLELQGEIIGAALCFTYPETGWLRQMGVGLAIPGMEHLSNISTLMGSPLQARIIGSRRLMMSWPSMIGKWWMYQKGC